MDEISAAASAPETATRSTGRRLPLWARVLAAALLIAAAVLLGRSLGDRVPAFARWVEAQGAAGAVVFVLGYALATVAMIPGSLITLAAGAIFGLAAGTAYAFLGATLGASLAFLVSRYVARRIVERRLAASPRFAAVDRAVGREGAKIVLLLRLSPVVPFNLLNYALGLTGVRFLDYLAACLGMLPGTLLYVYYGKVAGDLSALAGGAAVERNAASWALLGLGLAATLAVTVFVTRLARRALEEELPA